MYVTLFSKKISLPSVLKLGDWTEWVKHLSLVGETEMSPCASGQLYRFVKFPLDLTSLTFLL